MHITYVSLRITPLAVYISLILEYYVFDLGHSVIRCDSLSIAEDILGKSDYAKSRMRKHAFGTSS